MVRLCLNFAFSLRLCFAFQMDLLNTGHSVFMTFENGERFEGGILASYRDLVFTVTVIDFFFLFFFFPVAL